MAEDWEDNNERNPLHNLPDPRSWVADSPSEKCSVHGFEEGWRHVVEKHVRNPMEPWEQWVTATIVREVVEAAAEAMTPERWDQAIDRLAEAMKDAVDRTFCRPLAVLVRERRFGTAYTVRKWLLVLPVGAQMVVTCDTRAGNLLVTCLFPEEVCDEEPEDRWRVLAETMIRQYCPQVHGGGRRHPPQSKVFTKRRAGRLHDCVQFVTLESWGFDAADRARSVKIEECGRRTRIRTTSDPSWSSAGKRQ